MYASVGTAKTPVDIVADSSGEFSLKFNRDPFAPTDSLKLSSIGYYPSVIGLYQLLSQNADPENPLTFNLRKKPAELPELVIVSKQKPLR